VYLQLSGELTFHNKEFFIFAKNCLIFALQAEDPVTSENNHENTFFRHPSL
jgi:hypothetical protein